MKSLGDMLGKKVTISIRNSDDIEGILLSIENGGYFIKEDNDNHYFVPEANNVVFVEEYVEEEE